MATSVTYRLVIHAAHTGRGSGWDLDEWDVVAPGGWRPGQALPRGVPAGAEYHHGYARVAGGEKHFVFTRKAPMSPGVCERCHEPTKGSR